MAKADPQKPEQDAPPSLGDAVVHDGALSELAARIAVLETAVAERDAALAAAHQRWLDVVEWIARLNARATLAELSAAHRQSIRLDEVPRFPSTTVATYDVVHLLTTQALHGPPETVPER